MRFKPERTKLFLSILGTSTVLILNQSFAEGLQDVESFFNAKGTVIKVIGNTTAVGNKGLPYFKPGFPVKVEKVTVVENPLTGKKTTVPIATTGEGFIKNAAKDYAVIYLTKGGNKVKTGDVYRLNYNRICFVGEDRTFAVLSKELPVVKVSKKNISNCRWTVEETPEGFRVLLNATEVFFAKKNLPQIAYSVGKNLQSLNILVEPFELASYNEIPTSVDTLRLGSTLYAAVAFPEGIRLYQVVGDDLVDIGYIPTPVGSIVGVRLFSLNGNLYILGNAFTDEAKPTAFVATLVGTNPVIIKEAIPYYLTVLDQTAPEKTFIAQDFSNGKGGEVYKVNFDGNNLSVGEKLNLPHGFYAPSAVLDGKRLAFVDDKGSLHVYEGSLERGFKPVATLKGDFGQSYTYVKRPAFEGGGVIFFPPRPLPVQLFGYRGFLVAENHRRAIAPILASKWIQFTGGVLHFVATVGGKGEIVDKPLNGYIFQDAVQGMAVDPQKGTPFVITGHRNPFLFIQKGKLYRVEFKYF